MKISIHDKKLVIGNFNVSVKENYMKCFCDNYGPKNLIGKPKCYKNSENPTCIDLTLTNMPRSFQSTCAIEKGLSGFPLMTLIVMRKEYQTF